MMRFLASKFLIACTVVQMLMSTGPILNIQAYREKLAQAQTCSDQLAQLFAVGTEIEHMLGAMTQPSGAAVEAVNKKIAEYGALIKPCKLRIYLNPFDKKLMGYKDAVSQKISGIKPKLDALVEDINASFKNAEYGKLPDFGAKASALLQLKTEAKKLNVNTKTADTYYTAYFDIKKVVEDMTKYRTELQAAQKAAIEDPKKVVQLTRATNNFSAALKAVNVLCAKLPELCG